MPHDGRTGDDEMVKTRLSTVPEILDQIKQNIVEVERSLELTRNNSQESRLKGQLEILESYRSMIIC